MKNCIKLALVAVVLFAAGNSASLAQSFVPSPQQIEQFKNLPRAQQEQLARQMGFDLSILDGVNKQSPSSESTPVEFVERDTDPKETSEVLSKQSAAPELSTKLKPFGYDIFESRERPVSPSANMPVPSNYSLGPGDSLKLQLFGKETGSYELTVNNEGNIDIPELGPLSVTGVSFDEAKSLIAEKYEKQKIGVTPFLSMGQLRTIQVFMVGEVYRPGPLVVSSLSTITTALLNGGGINNVGSLRNIQVKRGGKTVARFDLYDLIANGDTSNDITLQQGDVLFVPIVGNIVSLGGEVRRPALYEMKPGETVADLLSLSGGFLPTADSSAIQLIRSSGSKGLSILNVNSEVASNRNMVLANGDFLRVPEAKQEFANAIMVSGAINLPNLISNTNLSLSNLITTETIMANTDLTYALLLRKGQFEEFTTIIQFSPSDVIDGNIDHQLKAFDEIIIFNRVAKDTADGVAEDVTKSSIRASSELAKSDQASFAQKQETERFTSAVLDDVSTASQSRKKLLAPIIARLKSEASSDKPVQLFEVRGQVKYPGVYPLPIDSSLDGVLLAAGGLSESAFMGEAEISSSTVLDGQLQVQHKRVNLEKQLELPHRQQVKLKSKDVLNVVRIPQWFENKTVELRGEVVFPGRYQFSQGETLSSIIKRAGGLTQEATPGAAVFSRLELKVKERNNIEKSILDLREQLANNNLSNNQFSRTIDYENATKVLNDLSDITPVGRMVIDLEALLQGDSQADLVVKDGDVLVVPNVTPAVSIIGEVFVASTYMFDETLSVDDYIQLAGGIREYGASSKVYIVKANGAVFVPRDNFWFGGEAERVLEPGDTIVVPRDVTNYENISLWQGITQIVYQTAVAIAAIGSL